MVNEALLYQSEANKLGKHLHGAVAGQVTETGKTIERQGTFFGEEV